ncbi:ECF transporter S component [Aerococcus vaginalis]
MNRDVLRQNAVFCLFLALLILQTFVPWLGYLPLGVADVTIVHITVILGASLIGGKRGALLGLSWGILAMIRNLMTPGVLAPLFYNPLVAILPRLAVGAMVGFGYPKLKAKFNTVVSGTTFGATGAMVNTALVVVMVSLFSRKTYATLMGIPESKVMIVFLMSVLSNAVFEIIAAAILVPLILIPLEKVMQRKR